MQQITDQQREYTSDGITMILRQHADKWFFLQRHQPTASNKFSALLRDDQITGWWINKADIAGLYNAMQESHHSGQPVQFITQTGAVTCGMTAPWERLSPIIGLSTPATPQPVHPRFIFLADGGNRLAGKYRTHQKYGEERPPHKQMLTLPEPLIGTLLDDLALYATNASKMVQPQTQQPATLADIFSRRRS